MIVPLTVVLLGLGLRRFPLQVALLKRDNLQVELPRKVTALGYQGY